MPLFKEPRFDAERERDHAEARLAGGRGEPNVGVSAYVLPLGGALIAIAVAAYAVTRPSVKDRLWRSPAPSAPTLIEVELD